MIAIISINVAVGMSLIAACLPSAIIGIIVWGLEKKLEHIHAVQERRELDREDYEALSIQAIRASIALGEATAIALQNGHTNGETEAALDYARTIKHKQTDFLARQAAKTALH